jgi:hypothetical protein
VCSLSGFVRVLRRKVAIMGSSKLGGDVGNVRWAERIVERYEAGERVRTQERDAAMQVLGIKPGTLVKRGKNPKFDRMAVVAGDA